MFLESGCATSSFPGTLYMTPIYSHVLSKLINMYTINYINIAYRATISKDYAAICSKIKKNINRGI